MAIYYMNDSDYCWFSNTKRTGSYKEWSVGLYPASHRTLIIEGNTLVLPEDCEYLFGSIKNTSLDFSKIDMSNVKYCRRLFSDSSLQHIDLSAHPSTQIENVNEMFYNSQSLVSLNMEGWKFDNLTTANRTFYFCNNLESIMMDDGTDWNGASGSYVFTSCSKLPGYDSNTSMSKANNTRGGYFSSPTTSIYYKVIDDNCYYRSSDADGYTQLGNIANGEDSPSNGKNIIIELVDDKFYLQPNSSNIFYGATNTTFNDLDK